MAGQVQGTACQEHLSSDGHCMHTPPTARLSRDPSEVEGHVRVIYRVRPGARPRGPGRKAAILGACTETIKNPAPNFRSFPNLRLRCLRCACKSNTQRSGFGCPRLFPLCPLRHADLDGDHESCPNVVKPWPLALRTRLVNAAMHLASFHVKLSLPIHMWPREPAHI